MGILEKLFPPKKSKLTPEQEKESRRVKIVREILAIEKRIEELRKNIETFGRAPADTALMNSFLEQTRQLNQELVRLGGKPITLKE